MPQVVIVEDVLLKIVTLSLEHVALNTANKTLVLIVFVQLLILRPQLLKGVDDNAEDQFDQDDDDQDKERQVVNEPPDVLCADERVWRQQPSDTTTRAKSVASIKCGNGNSK